MFELTKNANFWNQQKKNQFLELTKIPIFGIDRKITMFELAKKYQFLELTKKCQFLN
ncbi:MAG TPA: hypothetical protein VE128_00020 [Candidatus Angelobacter sp.]|nr:hypothetical protein [Candidatus Angelobacter sp.]